MQNWQLLIPLPADFALARQRPQDSTTDCLRSGAVTTTATPPAVFFLFMEVDVKEGNEPIPPMATRLDEMLTMRESLEECDVLAPPPPAFTAVSDRPADAAPCGATRNDSPPTRAGGDTAIPAAQLVHVEALRRARATATVIRVRTATSSNSNTTTTTGLAVAESSSDVTLWRGEASLDALRPQDGTIEPSRYFALFSDACRGAAVEAAAQAGASFEDRSSVGRERASPPTARTLPSLPDTSSGQTSASIGSLPPRRRAVATPPAPPTNASHTSATAPDTAAMATQSVTQFRCAGIVDGPHSVCRFEVRWRAADAAAFPLLLAVFHCDRVAETGNGLAAVLLPRLAQASLQAAQTATRLRDATSSVAATTFAAENAAVAAIAREAATLRSVVCILNAKKRHIHRLTLECDALRRERDAAALAAQEQRGPRAPMAAVAPLVSVSPHEGSVPRASVPRRDGRPLGASLVAPQPAPVARTVAGAAVAGMPLIPLLSEDLTVHASLPPHARPGATGKGDEPHSHRSTARVASTHVSTHPRRHCDADLAALAAHSRATLSLFEGDALVDDETSTIASDGEGDDADDACHEEPVDWGDSSAPLRRPIPSLWEFASALPAHDKAVAATPAPAPAPAPRPPLGSKRKRDGEATTDPASSLRDLF